MSSQQLTRSQNGATTTTETKTQFFVTSSVLNQMVTELDQNGAKTRTFVYQGSQVLAWQQQNGSTQTVAWEHRDVSNASVKISGSTEGSNAAELEPMGMDAGAFHLIAPPPPQHPPLVEARTYPGFADMVLGSQCRVDGIDMPCAMAGGETTALCPNNDCGPQVINGELVSFIAYDDGSTSFDQAREAGVYYPDGVPKGLRKTRRKPDGFFDHEPNLGLSPQKSDSFRNTVEKAFDRTAKILEGDSECAKFFGLHAKEALEAMRQKIQVFPKSGGPGGVGTGISQSNYPGGVNAIPSGPYRTPGAFIVYTNGPFFMQGKGTIAGYNPGTQMAQNAAILHELAHNIKNVIGDGFLIQNDGPGTKQGLSQHNTDLIKQKCGDQIFRGH